ncbi:phosphate import ATP-binding protein PstB [Clostridium homopropionicum DSM 5847]|uniref:Phosphate import ATP-binding protein PstB n=1 Tax=Clostridium homopropionicum DSM 5847 TaxID=1121318 RepID=A0A0L6Z581_9CLOT|nr:ATP-binding cassette domain-containing protein [Clostridium homopropionicum]KOA18116.1 phosphate import ATP-binding protein PstB [Clostridium homopropionicum DSM 5847]SFG72369.1 putative ABC transport system ATP-binding protein [Clostridium homopropionicum]
MYTLKAVKYKNILKIDELHIPKEKVTCIIGQSGSGKTTLIRLLNKLISCEEGEILYKGKNLKEVDSILLRREVIMLPQNPVIFPGTIQENLLIGLKFSEKPLVSENELLEMLSFLNLEKSLKENAEKLSGGEKQRISLGRILLMEPEVLLLDEPSSALDEETENLIISKVITYVKSNKKTLTMVTHSSRVAEIFSDNIIEIAKGKIINHTGGKNLG